MRKLNARLRDIERRVRAAEDDQGGRLSELETRCRIQGARLGVFLVVARQEIEHGQGEYPAAVLAALPVELAGVLRERLDKTQQGAINVRAEIAAIEPFLPLDEGTAQRLAAYEEQGFARLRSPTKLGKDFQTQTEEKLA